MYNFTKSPMLDNIKSSYLEALNKSNSFIDLSFEKVEKLAAINLSTAKETLDENFSNIKKVIETKSPSELSSLFSNNMKSNVAGIQSYFKKVQEVVINK